jgi:hypothetical protein
MSTTNIVDQGWAGRTYYNYVGADASAAAAGEGPP